MAPGLIQLRELLLQSRLFSTFPDERCDTGFHYSFSTVNTLSSSKTPPRRFSVGWDDLRLQHTLSHKCDFRKTH